MSYAIFDSSTFVVFFFIDTATTEIYTLSLHDALPIYHNRHFAYRGIDAIAPQQGLEALEQLRSEEHTSELQSRRDLVCRLLLEKKKLKKQAFPLYIPLRFAPRMNHANKTVSLYAYHAR